VGGASASVVCARGIDEAPEFSSPPSGAVCGRRHCVQVKDTQGKYPQERGESVYPRVRPPSDFLFCHQNHIDPTVHCLYQANLKQFLNPLRHFESLECLVTETRCSARLSINFLNRKLTN